jgi:dTDP-4-dehydrorhamnose 3,5-epimerase
MLASDADTPAFALGVWMRFLETAVAGAILIDIEPRRDNRGFFARIFDEAEFAERGLDPRVAQCSVAYNAVRGTLRGLHSQPSLYEETKVMRCVRGTLYAVAADLRPTSPTYLGHVGVELTAENRLALYVPKGCFSGYQTLRDDTEIMYQMATPYVPGAECGVHYADPTLAVTWPLPVTAISERDANLPSLEPVPAHLERVATSGSQR